MSLDPEENKALTDKERAEIWRIYSDNNPEPFKDECGWAIDTLRQAVEFLEEEREWLYAMLARSEIKRLTENQTGYREGFAAAEGKIVDWLMSIYEARPSHEFAKLINRGEHKKVEG